MIPDYLQEAERLRDTLAALRADFHARPELGNREFKTAARIIKEKDAGTSQKTALEAALRTL